MLQLVAKRIQQHCCAGLKLCQSAYNTSAWKNVQNHDLLSSGSLHAASSARVRRADRALCAVTLRCASLVTEDGNRNVQGRQRRNKAAVLRRSLVQASAWRSWIDDNLRSRPRRPDRWCDADLREDSVARHFTDIGEMLWLDHHEVCPGKFCPGKLWSIDHVHSPSTAPSAVLLRRTASSPRGSPSTAVRRQKIHHRTDSWYSIP